MKGTVLLESEVHLAQIFLTGLQQKLHAKGWEEVLRKGKLSDSDIVDRYPLTLRCPFVSHRSSIAQKSLKIFRLLLTITNILQIGNEDRVIRVFIGYFSKEGLKKNGASCQCCDWWDPSERVHY